MEKSYQKSGAFVKLYILSSEVLSSEVHAKANKAAVKVLEILTASCRLTPDPDPEKQILRAIKAVIRQSCEIG